MDGWIHGVCRYHAYPIFVARDFGVCVKRQYVTKNGKGVEGWEAVKETPPKLKGKRKKEKKKEKERRNKRTDLKKRPSKATTQLGCDKV